MASFRSCCLLFLLFASASGVLATTLIQCEDLPSDECSFSVSSTGARCVLEKFQARDGQHVYVCQTSDIMAKKAEEWIETDECISECGLERMWIGFSSDGIASPNFIRKLCSPVCQNNCPNIVDLFSSLAADEGVHLGKVCEYVRPSAHRILADSLVFKNTNFVIQSLANAVPVAEAPQGSLVESLTLAPAPSPQ